MVKAAGRSFGRKKNYGLTVTVSSKPWCGVGSPSVNNTLIIFHRDKDTPLVKHRPEFMNEIVDLVLVVGIKV
jgi:hypothetical protein